jgi:capsid protein
MPTYTQEFKDKVIAESATTSARKLAEKYDVSNRTISNWIKQANTQPQEATQPQIQAYNSGSSNTGYSNGFTNLFQLRLFENDTVNTANASNTSLDYSRWANLAYGARTLYMQNGIAATIVDRLVASVVNTGLILQAITDNLEDSKVIEKNFKLWADNPYLCDYSQQRNWSELQAQIYQLSLVYGDVLVVAHASKQNNLPVIQVISTDKLTNPLNANLPDGHYMQDGVQINKVGKQVAYWVTAANGTVKKISAYGRVSGMKRTAWLVYGHRTRRVNGVRGYPPLSVVYEFLKDVDKLSKANIKKGLLSSQIAAFVKKNMPESNRLPDYNPLAEAAGRTTDKKLTTTDNDNDVNFKEHSILDSTVLTGLNAGEEIVQIKQESMGTDFISYQQAQIKICAYALEVPPNVFGMEYDQSFNATQATNNQFNAVIEAKRTALINQHYNHVYSSFILGLAVNNSLSTSNGIVKAFTERNGLAFYGYCVCDWIGKVIQTSDLKKTTAALVDQIENKLITREQATNRLNNGSFESNIAKQAEENKKLEELGLVTDELEQTQQNIEVINEQ